MSNNLSAYRTRKGLSQYDLAHATGLSQTIISQYERGVAKPTAASASKIADALGTRVHRVFPKHGIDLKAFGSMGGKIAAQRMTPEARKDRARKAISARWRKSLNARLSELIADRPHAELRSIVETIEAAFPR